MTWIFTNENDGCKCSYHYGFGISMLKKPNHQTTGMGAEVNLVKCQRKNILVFVILETK